jgi:hypothetical protein
MQLRRLPLAVGLLLLLLPQQRLLLLVLLVPLAVLLPLGHLSL